MDTIGGRMDQNEEIFKRILDDDELRRDLLELHLARVYRTFRSQDDLKGGGRDPSGEQ